jgi:preprotein translocase subunit SecG
MKIKGRYAMTAILVALMFIIIITIGLIVTKVREKKRVEAFATRKLQSYAVFSKDSIFTPKGIYPKKFNRKR